MNKRELGFASEQKAVDFLVKNGYEIIERNFQYRGGEIDIITKTLDGTICFTEVKSASSPYWGDPVFNVTLKKQKQVGKTAEVWLAKKGISDTACRFDVVTVKGEKITHFTDAFRLNGPAVF
jgi:putative endonuclease